jgi:hypothetical protein
VFEVRIGSRTLVLLFHPDAVEHVTVADGASTTRLPEYGNDVNEKNVNDVD